MSLVIYREGHYYTLGNSSNISSEKVSELQEKISQLEKEINSGSGSSSSVDIADLRLRVEILESTDFTTEDDD